MGRSFFFNRFPITLRLLRWTASLFLGFVSIAAVVLYASLSSGPISLDFATSYIEDYFATQDAAHQVHVDNAELSWDNENGGLFVRVTNAHIRQDHGNDHMLKLPNFELRYKLTSLIKLKWTPSSITILEPHLKLHQDKDGAVSLHQTVGNDQAPGEFKDLLAGLVQGPLKSLDQLDVKSLHLNVENSETGKQWQIPTINLLFTRDRNNIVGDISLEGLNAKAVARLEGKIDKRDGVVKALELTLKADLHDFSFNDLGKFWQANLAPPARKWVLENLSNALVSKATLDAAWKLDLSQDTPLLMVSKMGGEIRFSDMVVRYFGDMPVVTGVKAVAKYTDKVFDIKIQDGYLQDIHVTDGRVYITGMDVKDQDIEIDLDVDGPLQTALKILDQEPLKLSKKLGMQLRDIKGRAKGKLHFEFPLETSLTLDQVRFQAKTALKNVSINKPMERLSSESLTQGQLDLTVDRDLLVVKGKSVYGKLPIHLVWTQKFQDAPQDWKVKYDVQADLSPEQCSRLGYEGYTDGPVLLKAQLTESSDASSKLNLNLDLTKSNVFLPGLETARQKGDKASLSLQANLVNGKIHGLANIKLTGKGIDIAPHIKVDPDSSRIRSIICHDAELGSSRFSFNMVTDKHQKYHFDLKGHSLDLEPFLSYLKRKTSEDVQHTPFYFNCNVEEALFEGGTKSLQGLQVSGYHGKEALEALKLTGRLHHKEQGHLGDLRIDQTSTAGNKAFRMHSDNAGEVLNMLGLSSSVKKGNIEINMTKAGNGHWTGKLKLRDFNMNNAPVATHLLSLASPFGIIEAVSGNSLHFSKFSTRLVFTPDKIYVKQGRAVGTSIGLNIAGTIDRKNDTTDLHGTILPYNALNLFLAKVPLVGHLLGGKGGGVLGLSYGISGPMEAPTSYVNPLSVLTPGILRNVFSHPEPDENDEKSGDD